MAQHVEVVLQIQHMLAMTVAAFVSGNRSATMPDLDMQRTNPRLHPGACLDRHRIEVGLDHDAALLVHEREHDLGEIKLFGRSGIR